jgi:hypothetical protein
MNIARDEKLNITTDTTELHRVTGIFENLYSNKLENVVKVHKFLYTSELLYLNQEGTKNPK